MYKRATIFEKTLQAIILLSVFSIPFLRDEPTTYFPSYTIFLSVFLVFLSQTIRLWKSISLREKIFSSIAIFSVVSGSTIFITQKWTIGIIIFLIAIILQSIAVERALKKPVKKQIVHT